MRSPDPAAPARRLSIIIPALNEAPRIVATLERLQRWRTAGHEVIVVDGGSDDDTPALAAPLADRVLAAPRGRALQMNAGAAVAAGDVLLFVHADTHLPDNALDEVGAGLIRSARAWGRFDVALEGGSAVLPMVAALMNRRSRLTGIATGDQAIFVTRALFDHAGGFPVQPLMEDIALSRRLRRVGGKPLCLRQRVVSSGRRWDHRGGWRTILLMWRLRFAYWRGVSPLRLAARYDDDARRWSGASPTLQIFAKAPVPGRVKTRLAARVGDAAAAAIHAQLTEQTLRTAVAARDAGIVSRVELWCAPDASHPAFAAWRDRHGVSLHEQQGADLGARMRYALHASLARGDPALLIGTDCPALDTAYLARAGAALHRHDAVFGPAKDGGYVLLGLTRNLDLFTGIAWSTREVMAATRLRLRRQQATWCELGTLWDVDRPADLARWHRGFRSPLPQ